MPLISFEQILRLTFALALLLGVAGRATAQDNALPVIDILPAKSASAEEMVSTGKDEGDTHPPLRLTPDKSELVRLDKNAGTIIIGNPDHLSVLADSARTLVLVPRMPGATSITVLDTQGATLMQRHVIVAAPKKKYIRVRKSCASSEDDSCQETQVYYCPDMCHEVNVVSEDSESSDSPFDALEDLVENTAAAGEEPENEE